MQPVTQKDSKNQALIGIKEEKSHFTVEKSGKNTYYISPVMKTKIKYSYAGIHWKMAKKQKIQDLKNIEFQIRTSADGKSWSDWKTAHVDLENQDPTSSEVFADLVATKKGQAIQYRLLVNGNVNPLSIIANIQLTLLNTEDGPKGIKKPTKANKPKVVTRKEWGANENLRYKNQDPKQGLKEPQRYRKVTHIMIHHTGDEGPLDGQTVEEYLRAIYYYHTVTRNWADIGYNALIGPDGTVYEGRKGLSDNQATLLNDGIVGAHTYGYNPGSFGISLIGNYEHEPLPQVMRKSLIQLLAYEAHFWHIDPVGRSDYKRTGDYDKSKFPPVDRDIPNITGHGLTKYSTTDCPGKHVIEDLGNIKQDVKKELGR